METKPKRELVRRPSDGVVAGVCAGLATYFDTNVSIVRAIFVGLIVFNGFGLLAYVALAFLLDTDRPN